MYKIILLIGLLLSPPLFAQVPDEFAGQTMQDGQQWSEQMWPKSAPVQELTINDFYLMYSYNSPTEMAEDFAEQLCLNNFNYYLKIGTHAFIEDGFEKTFMRNSLLEELFHNSEFLIKLNTCLEAHNKSVESVVIAALAASQTSKALNFLGIGYGLVISSKLVSYLSVKLVNATSKMFEKVIAKSSYKKIPSERLIKNSLESSKRNNLANGISALKQNPISTIMNTGAAATDNFKRRAFDIISTTGIIAGSVYVYGFDEKFNNPAIRKLEYDDSQYASPRYNCALAAEKYKAKKARVEEIYIKRKQQLTEPEKLDLLEIEYEIMQTLLMKEKETKGMFYDKCESLSPYMQ